MFYMITLPLTAVFLILSILAQLFAWIRTHRMDKVECSVSGLEYARALLEKKGSSLKIGKPLGGNQPPEADTVVLPELLQRSNTAASLGLVLHETAAALRRAEGKPGIAVYETLRSFAEVAAYAAVPALLGAYLLGMPLLIRAGILCYLAAAVFYLVTLPLELQLFAICRPEDGIESRADREAIARMKAASVAGYLAGSLELVLQLLQHMLSYSGRRGAK